MMTEHSTRRYFALHSCAMGIADRDYTRANYEPGQAQRAVGAMRMWSVTTWLLAINIAVFVLNNVLSQERALIDTQTREIIKYVRFWDIYGAFNIVEGIYRFQIWRFITFQFLHFDFTHLLFNMFTLYMFGTLIEQYLGRRRFLAFYLLSG